MNHHPLMCSSLPVAMVCYITLNTAWMASYATLNICQSAVDVIYSWWLFTTTCTQECDLIWSFLNVCKAEGLWGRAITFYFFSYNIPLYCLLLKKIIATILRKIGPWPGHILNSIWGLLLILCSFIGCRNLRQPSFLGRVRITKTWILVSNWYNVALNTQMIHFSNLQLVKLLSVIKDMQMTQCKEKPPSLCFTPPGLDDIYNHALCL